MCGIHVVRLEQSAGARARAEQAVRQMLDACAYRGPDEQGIVIHEDAEFVTVLGHNRLRLRGGELGRQPITLEGKGTLVYNGQLFGEDIGPSDTAALARALAEDYFDFLETHHGMGAFVWQQASTGHLLIGRDRFGIKPLFYAKTPAGLVISSEVRGVFASGLIRPKTDPSELAEVLIYRCTPQQVGIYANLAAFGQGLTWVKGLEIEPVTPQKMGAEKGPLKKEKRGLKEALKASLLQNLESERPVGLMLSGGVDSSLLACLAAEEGIKLPCFTTEGPEAEAAKSLAKRLRLPWYSVSVPRGTQDWLDFLAHSPSPIADPGAYMTWCVAREAQAVGVPVLLSGAGADELFLGYRRHQIWKKYGRTLSSPLYAAVSKVFHAFDARLPLATSTSNPASIYRQLLAAKDNLADHLNLPKVNRSNTSIGTLNPYELDCETYLPHQILAATDLYSMAHSVEVRVPYLTQELQNIAAEYGSTELLKSNGKAPLRSLFTEYGIQMGTKRGFGPHTDQYPNYNEIEDALGLNNPRHPIYTHLLYYKVAKWREFNAPLQARMAFWSAAIMFHVEQVNH